METMKQFNQLKPINMKEQKQLKLSKKLNKITRKLNKIKEKLGVEQIPEQKLKSEEPEEPTEKLNLEYKEDIYRQIVKDSIIKDYIRYSEYLEDRNYIRESITLHENLSKIVSINNLKAGNEGIVLDILCPPGNIISIPGIKSFPENYDIENIRPFELILANSNNIEIDPGTKVKILKNKILRKPEEICETSYKDINHIDYSESPNKFKIYSNFYRFENGIELKGEDHLKIHVINPNVDIDIVKFNLGTNFWLPR